jgi:hypothetical protein
VPEPLLFIVIVYVVDVSNWAVQDFAESTVTKQLELVPQDEQSPPHPEKVEPLSAEAVRVTEVLEL